MVINGPTLVADAILNRVWLLATRMLDVKLRLAKLDFSWNFGLAYGEIFCAHPPPKSCHVGRHG